MKNLFVLITLFLFIAVQANSQGNPAQFRKDGNKSWFKDFQQYNGFGTTAPSHTWHFVGELFSSTQVTAPIGSFTTLPSPKITSPTVTGTITKGTSVTDTVKEYRWSNGHKWVSYISLSGGMYWTTVTP